MMRDKLCGSIKVFFLIALILTFFSCATADESQDDNDDSSENKHDDSNDPYQAPDSRGPYEVGVRTEAYVDNSRFMVYGNIPRTLMTEIWYPIEKPGDRLNTIGDFLGELPDWAPQLAGMFFGDGFETLLAMQTSAWRNAQPVKPDKPFPVILFSHGLTAVRFQNHTLCEYLASHGFIVVAPDHYDNAVFTNIPGSFLFFNPISTATAAIQRPRDIAFLIKALTRQARAEGSFLYGLADVSHVGVSGHSYGGMTSFQAGERLAEVTSIAPINAVILKELSPSFAKPVLILIGDKDSMATNTFNSNERVLSDFERLGNRKSLVYLLNSGHYSATDACDLLPPGLIPDATTGCGGNMISSETANRIFASYATAFFSYTLKHDSRYLDFLEKNQFPENVDYKAKWDLDNVD